MVITCKIKLDDNPRKVVYSGQILNGTVHLSLTERETVRSVKIHIVGKSCVEAKFGDTTYTMTEHILDSEMYVAGSNDKSSKITFTPGVHTFKFQYVLSPDTPSTMHNYSVVATASTSYEIRVVVDIPFCMDRKFITPFTVIRPRDLSLDRTLRLPLAVKGCKKFAMNCLLFCRTSEPLEIVAGVPVRGYCPGETINLELDVKNRSRQTVTKFTVKLTKRITSFYNKNLTDCTFGHTVISRKETRGCRCNHYEEIQVNLEVPLTLPTDISTIIKVEYFIAIIAHVGCCHSDPALHIPIVIGTVPFRGY